MAVGWNEWEIDGEHFRAREDPGHYVKVQVRDSISLPAGEWAELPRGEALAQLYRALFRNLPPSGS